MNKLKIINASQGYIHQYENVKRKLLSCNADIYFNQQCVLRKLTPKYARFKIPNRHPAAKTTAFKAQSMRVKEEIKFLYMKKQQLNTKLYHVHLNAANTWGNTWYYIQGIIEAKLNRQMKEKYVKLGKKLQKLALEQTTTPKTFHDFYPRVVNKSNIAFTKGEITLLNKGLKYNLHHKKGNWLTNLALEAETAINFLPLTDRDYYRKQVSNHITQLQQNSKLHRHTHYSHIEWKTLKSITTKLKTNDAIATPADKGNTIVILPTTLYQEKILNFIQSNNFRNSNTNPTKKFQRQVRQVINNSPNLINPNDKWKYTNLNPTAPSIRGLVKIHKPELPIRPIVNWCNAPAYKLAKMFALKIQQLTPLPFSFNIKNSSQLIHELKQTPLTPSSRFASLDITNMYSNIPIKETRQILRNILTDNAIDLTTSNEMTNVYEVITKQNYFVNKDNIVIQDDGLAMGAPSSSIISELFLQHLEQTKLPHIAHKLKLLNYFRYVDDILIVFDSQHTNINEITKEFNTLHPNIQFTEETEKQNKINYLDITIHRQHTHVNISIFRKPTYTDTIIPYTSNHPAQHKQAAIRFLYNRLNSYQLTDKEYLHEQNIIHNILFNNGFAITDRKMERRQLQVQRTQPITQPITQKKWCTFTYVGRETAYITKLFRHTNLKIAYRTVNTLQKHLLHNTTQQDKYSKSGIYKLTCPDCSKVYVGQTGRNFYTRYDEHKRAFRYNTSQSKYAKHAIEQGHRFGNLENIMEILQFQKKGYHLNTIERYHIHKEVKNNNHLNEDYTDTSNNIFNTIIEQLQ
jgi:hypothetical protein